MTALYWSTILGAAVVTCLLTAAVRRYALSRSMLDVPGPRSSHVRPTPRGGGLAIAAVVLGALVAGAVAGIVPLHAAVGVAGGGTLVAAVGWLDDRLQLSSLVRILTHGAAAVWLLAWVGGLPAVTIGTMELPLGIVGHVGGVVLVVWLTNLYNFMDGIDGFAAGEGVSVGIAGGVLLFAAGWPVLGLLGLLIAAACGGFMVWNWEPAKIFMGDVGSGLLGFLFAALAVLSERTGAVPLLVWLMLLGVFVADSTVTLIRRIARGEQWWAAHRSHAYQRAVQHGLSHGAVAATLLAVNVLIGGVAYVAIRRPALQPALAGATFLFLGALYLGVERLSPMRPETTPQ